uniref:Putative secreted protein n=1 Tax=Anopheles darlingi TaxID=43151 RepID=A0A2M4DKJ4_ANODA
MRAAILRSQCSFFSLCFSFMIPSNESVLDVCVCVCVPGTRPWPATSTANYSSVLHPGTGLPDWKKCVCCLFKACDSVRRNHVGCWQHKYIAREA